MTTFCDLFQQQVAAAPQAVAIHAEGADVTYAQLAESAAQVADWLRSRGTQRGDRVLLVLPNTTEYVASYLGILQADCVAVALNPHMSPAEISAIIDDCTPTGAIVEPRWVDAVAECIDELPPQYKGHEAAVTSDAWTNTNSGRSSPGPANPLSESDIAQIIYTSGTSGKPKGVTLTHRNLVANCRSIISYLKLTSQDSALVVLPFFYSYGNSILCTHLACGGRLILASDFVFWNRALKLMQEQQATGFAGVPSSFAILLHKSDFRTREFPHLRYLTCAGGRLAPAHVDELVAAVPGAELFLMYGQTEATARLSTLMPADLTRKPGSIGTGIPGVTLAVLDDEAQPVPPGTVGEIVANGPNLMAGYWNDPELTSQVLRPEGLRTGDLAYRDEEGFIYIVGRKDDMIKSGAHRIFPADVEDVISRLSEVAEVAVIGVHDELLYQKPVAFVVPSGGVEHCDPEKIIDICRSALPAYKRPREIRIVESLPKTASGKIKRAAIRNWGLPEDIVKENYLQAVTD